MATAQHVNPGFSKGEKNIRKKIEKTKNERIKTFQLLTHLKHNR